MATEAALPVEFLSTTRLGEKGQLTIPKQYRQSLALDAGAPIAVLQLGNGLLLIPEQARFRALCDRVSRVFSAHGVTARELLATLPEARQLVFTRLYPRLARGRKTRSRKARIARRRG
jgi:bifunctional DNA-binding transcriptional regulator/antitoxin component of YhaV-PrlF toxin-antitoxin module